MKQFPLELLVEQVISSAAPMPLSPGDGFRRIFESLAGKILSFNRTKYFVRLFRLVEKEW